MKPLVAIVGRPNVGKSTLFNRILGQRQSIVEGQPGVTRDRLYGEAEWCGREFTLVDTGGILGEGEGALAAAVRSQAEQAIAEADLILLVVDVRRGLLPADQEVAQLLRRCGKPVLVAVNKLESPSASPGDFYRLGLGEPEGISAEHGLGIGDLLDRVVAALPPASAATEEPGLRVTLAGRPNAGKSSLVNRLLGQARVVIDDAPGTTRDPVDSYLTWRGRRFVLVDTAGIRRRARPRSVEGYSVLRAVRAMEKSDVVLLIVDASMPVSEQDQRLAGQIMEAGKALAVLLNKWDLVPGDAAQGVLERAKQRLYFVEKVPFLTVSARTGAHLERILETAAKLGDEHSRRVEPGELKDLIREAMLLQAPPAQGRRRLQVQRVAQTGVRPPTFTLWVNDPKLASPGYRRYLHRQLVEGLHFAGLPVRLTLREADR